MNALIFLSLVGLACGHIKLGYRGSQFDAHPHVYSNQGAVDTPYLIEDPSSFYNPSFLYKYIYPTTANNPGFRTGEHTNPFVLNTAGLSAPVGFYPFAYHTIPTLKTADRIAPVVDPSIHFVPRETHSQFHAQNNDGTYNYGYHSDLSSKHEIKDKFGIVRGAYNYIDANNEIQTVQYISDALGFRVAATNLPAANQELPKPVQETAAVKAARAEHEAAKFRTKRSISKSKVQYPASTSPLIKTFSHVPNFYSAEIPLTYNHLYPNVRFAPTYGHPQPLVYSGFPSSYYINPSTFRQVNYNPGHTSGYIINH